LVFDVVRNRNIESLMKRIVEGEIDPSFLITHMMKLEVDRRPIRRSATRRAAVSKWF